MYGGFVPDVENALTQMDVTTEVVCARDRLLSSDRKSHHLLLKLGRELWKETRDENAIVKNMAKAQRAVNFVGGTLGE